VAVNPSIVTFNDAGLENVLPLMGTVPGNVIVALSSSAFCCADPQVGFHTVVLPKHDAVNTVWAWAVRPPMNSASAAPQMTLNPRPNVLRIARLPCFRKKHNRSAQREGAKKLADGAKIN
jgi:hypothetical protein